MTAMEEPRASLQLDNHEVFRQHQQDKHQFPAGRDCDETDSPSDSDYSYMGTINGGGSYGNLDTLTEDQHQHQQQPLRSILKVRTQKESEGASYDDNKQMKKKTSSCESTANTTTSSSSSSSASAAEGSSAVAAAETEAETETAPTTTPSVQFQDVEIREYPYCLGDNPSVLQGVPLSIEWEPQSSGRLSVEDYEASRPDRRCSEQLHIPSFLREELLRHSGYSRKDIQKGVREVNIARQQRRRTNETKQLQVIQALTEKVVRGTRNATVYRTKKQQERDWILQLKQQDHQKQQGSYSDENKKATRAIWQATVSTASSSSSSTSNCGQAVVRPRASEPNLAEISEL